VLNRCQLYVDAERVVSVFSPQQPDTDDKTAQRNVLVHLPTGPPLIPGPWPIANEQTSLLALASPRTTIVTIHYRLSSPIEPADADTYFPTPIHDVCEGLDFLTSSSSPFNYGDDLKPKISLLGAHMGGGLAAMLALTQPNDLHAVTLVEPMVDWVGLDELIEQLQESPEGSLESDLSAFKRASPKKRRVLQFIGINDKSVFAAAEQLVNLRARLFKTPSAYFDPFASPLLFLRAPGRDTPQETKGDVLMREMGIERVEEIADESFGPYDDDWGQSKSSSTASSTVDPESSSKSKSTLEEASAKFVPDIIAPEHSATLPPQPTEPPRRREVLRRWPSIGRPEDVLLPHTKIFLHSPSVGETKELTNHALNNHQNSDVNLENGLQALLHAQDTEFAELMRRACFYGREIGFANERVMVQEVPSVGLEGHKGSSLYQHAVHWANEILKED